MHQRLRAWATLWFRTGDVQDFLDPGVRFPLMDGGGVASPAARESEERLDAA